MGKKYDAELIQGYCDTMTDAYTVYEQEIDHAQSTCSDFADNSSFIGIQAEISKEMVGVGEINLMEDILAVNHIIRQAQVDIMDMFAMDVDAAENARIDEETLEQVNYELVDYYNSFDAIGKHVEAIHAQLAPFSKYLEREFTKPDFDSGRCSLKELCGGNSQGGFIEETIQKLREFDTEATTMLQGLGLIDVIRLISGRILQSSSAMYRFSAYQSRRAQNLLYRPGLSQRNRYSTSDFSEPRVTLLKGPGDGIEYDEDLLANNWGCFDPGIDGTTTGELLLRIANVLYRDHYLEDPTGVTYWDGTREAREQRRAMHYENNLRILEDDSGPFTPGEMIENQADWSGVQYGSRTIGLNGCGSIAVANALNELGDTVMESDMANIIRNFERDGMIMDGALGTAPAAMEDFLKYKGCTVESTYSTNMDTVNELADESDTAIIVVWNDRNNHMDGGMHYMCATRDEDGYYQLHNAYTSDGEPLSQKDNVRFESLTDAVGAYNNGNAELVYTMGISR